MKGYKNVIVNDKLYVIETPTVKRYLQASKYITGAEDGGNFKSWLRNAKGLAEALSVFVKGDESLADELSEGVVDEVVDALLAAYSFMEPHLGKLSGIAKNVCKLTAKQKP